MKTMYAVTKVHEGLRVLANANQGRNHFDTREQAEQWLAAALANNSTSTLQTVWGDLSKVRVYPVLCYDHGDAVRTVLGAEGTPPDTVDDSPLARVRRL